MIVSKKIINSDSIELMISNTLLQRVGQIKYLGVIVDENLKFKDHLNIY